MPISLPLLDKNCVYLLFPAISSSSIGNSQLSRKREGRKRERKEEIRIIAPPPFTNRVCNWDLQFSNQEKKQDFPLVQVLETCVFEDEGPSFQTQLLLRVVQAILKQSQNWLLTKYQRNFQKNQRPGNEDRSWTHCLPVNAIITEKNSKALADVILGSKPNGWINTIN